MNYGYKGPFDMSDRFIFMVLWSVNCLALE